MKAGPTIIGQLLRNQYRFCVPIYQRHYVWNRSKQWEPFWNDIRSKAIERLSNRDRRFDHFMGAIVLESRGGFSARRVPSFQVVDGQQRLTTFQIFLAAARDFAYSFGYQSAIDNIETYLINRDPHLMENPEIEKFKIWPTEYDRELFIDILTLGGRGKLREKYPEHFFKKKDQIYDYTTTPRLIAGYGYFFDQIKHAVNSDDLEDEFALAPDPDKEVTESVSDSNGIPREHKLDAIWQALVEEFKVVEITLEEGDDAQVIFETLNERGEPLLAADLVRNNIFQRADASGEEAERLFNTYWKLFEDPSWSQDEKQGRYKKPRIEFFLANYIAGQIAGEVSLTKLFSEYKAFIKTNRFNSIIDELQELNRYGRIYLELVSFNQSGKLVKFARQLQPWDVTTVFPFVIRLWATEMDSDDKADCLDMLISFIVRRAVCGLTTKAYNKLFLSAVSRMDNQGWAKNVLIKFFLDQKSDIGRFPDDNEFETQWIKQPLYKILPSNRSRYLLEELEKLKRTKFHEVSDLADGLTIEHILPQEWANHWPLADGSKPGLDQVEMAEFLTDEDDSTLGNIVRRNRLKNTIGNLTLLTQPLNSSVSNGPFTAKVNALKDHSLLVLNKEITTNTSWNETTIVNRSKELFKTALLVWPFIQINNEED